MSGSIGLPSVNHDGILAWLGEELTFEDFLDPATRERYIPQDPGAGDGRSEDPEVRRKEDLKARIVYLDVDGHFYEGGSIQEWLNRGNATSMHNRQPFAQENVHRIDEFAREALRLDKHLREAYQRQNPGAEIEDGEELPDEKDYVEGYAFPKRVDVVPTSVLRSWQEQGFLSKVDDPGNAELKRKLDARFDPHADHEEAPEAEYTIDQRVRAYLDGEEDLSCIQLCSVIAHFAFFFFTAFLEIAILCAPEQERMEAAIDAGESAAEAIASGQTLIYFG